VGVGRGNIGALFYDNADDEIRPTLSVRGDTMCHCFMVPTALTGIEPLPKDARRTGVRLVGPLIIKRSGLTYCLRLLSAKEYPSLYGLKLA
jgi:hypothetical protein